MLTLFTDSDCDVTPEIAKEYGYKLISMPYVIGDKTIFPYKDFDKFEYKKFYDVLRGGTLPKTCAINTEEYKEYFEPEFKAGNDILYVHFSAAMSGTFTAMNLAVSELLEQYPDRKFYSIDTKGITILSLSIVRLVGQMIKDGKSVDEVMEWSKKEIDHQAVYFYADDLKFFARSGRVSGFAGFMGNMIGLHPIIHIDNNGQMVSIDKAIGRKKALLKILEYVDKLGDDIKNTHIVVGHSDALSLAELVIDMLKKKYGENLDIETVVVNPTAGSHCGPNCIGIAFHAKAR
jgi:DegV family protein with EDD domain